MRKEQFPDPLRKPPPAPGDSVSQRGDYGMATFIIGGIYRLTKRNFIIKLYYLIISATNSVN